MLVWQEARKEARSLRDRLKMQGPQIDLLQVAAELDLSVTFRRLAHGYSGLIIKEEKEKAQIFIDIGENSERQRFTLAHEIGHYVERLLRGDNEFSFTDNGRGRMPNGDYDLHEFFADEFAGELLMPEEDFFQQIKSGKSPQEVAEHFGVSVPAVLTRVRRIQKAAEQMEDV